MSLVILESPWRHVSLFCAELQLEPEDEEPADACTFIDDTPLSLEFVSVYSLLLAELGESFFTKFTFAVLFESTPFAETSCLGDICTVTFFSLLCIFLSCFG